MSLPYTRRILRLSGKDTRSFLQGITTQDIQRLAPGALCFTAFLSPQGKLLFDGFLSPQGDDLLLDLDATQADAATAYILRYKLRADVALHDTGLTLALGEGSADPRHPALPHRAYLPAPDTLSAADYHAARLALAIPEAAYDTTGDDVAMDLGYDLLHGISFTKGCYVGQEVTARMHYRQIARRCVFHAAADTVPPSGTPVMAGEIKLGELRSSQAGTGLAVLRLDAWERACTDGLLITAASAPLTITLPTWAEPRLAWFRQGKREG